MSFFSLIRSIFNRLRGTDMKKLVAYRTVLGGKSMEKVFDGEFGKMNDPDECNIINVYDDVEYQEIYGFGGALTEAAAYCYSCLTEENKEKLVDLYYGEDGIGYSLGRIHMNSCDFSLSEYNCCDEESETLEGFNIDRDKQYMLPLIKAVNKKNECHLMVSPWSPPQWMKDTKKRQYGGKLLNKYYGLWAEHFVKYIRAMREEGADIRYVSVQNEAKAIVCWDSCCYTAEEERDFVKNHLGPALEKAGMGDIKIFVWDHNKERLYDRSKVVYDDPEASKYVWGTAFHWYSGDHFEALDALSRKYPDKKMFFTEGCVESYVDRGVELNAERYAHDIIGNFKNGMNGFIDWNILLDEKGGPNYVENYCDAPVRCDTKTGELFVRPAYYYIGHFSKFIKPGAVRVASSSYSEHLETVAFRNPDGRIVVEVLNRSNEELSFKLRYNEQYNVHKAPAHSLTTLIF